MTYTDGPASFLLDLSRIFEQLKRDQLSSFNPTEFYYYIRSPKEARQQQIPIIADKQVNLIQQLAGQSGYEVSKPENDEHQNLRLLISITDEDRFFTEYNKFASKYKEIAYSNKLKQTPLADEPNPVSRTIVEPRSYDAANGVLTINGTPIAILKQPNRKGVRGETNEAKLMRFLFDPVNSLQNGIPMRKVLSVREADFGAKERKLIKSYVTEINKKVDRASGLKELITCTQFAVMIDKRYL